MTETALLAAGCFWGVEETFRKTQGVVETQVGYAGGVTDNPDYRTVCQGATNHAEVVLVTYDPEQLSYESLLDTFFDLHDPTQMNRQGPDVGTQYRSAIFPKDASQEQSAKAKLSALEQSGKFAKPIATQVEPWPTFWPAEDYHQKYVAKKRGEL